jgi:hypothetical protein
VVNQWPSLYTQDMSTEAKNNRTDLIVILLGTALLVGCYACTGPERPKPSHARHAEPLPNIRHSGSYQLPDGTVVSESKITVTKKN